MIYCDMFQIMILLLIGAMSATAVPADMHCCSPELGVFVYLKPYGYCLKEKTRNPLRLTCPSHNIFDVDVLNLDITESGQVYYPNPLVGESTEMEPGEFCFANYTDSDDYENNVVALCSEEEKEKESVLAYCMAVSAVFLFLTILVYAVLPEIRDLQGVSLIHFFGSMAFGLTMLSISKLISYSDMTLCAVRGFIIYFFLMASFFWSNAISIQMLISLGRPEANVFEWKKIAWYASYAWGCPILLTVCMAIVNYYPGDHKRPGIGLNSCWFYNTKQQWYYMYSILTILIVANICIFIYTFIQLCRQSFSSNQTKALRYKCVMCLRMLIIMGITWIFEMIGSLTGKSIIWFIIDVFNALQGPLIFLVLVVFRKRVVKALLKRGYLCCLAEPLERYLAAKEDDEEGVMCDTGDALNEINTVVG